MQALAMLEALNDRALWRAALADRVQLVVDSRDAGRHCVQPAKGVALTAELLAAFFGQPNRSFAGVRDLTIRNQRQLTRLPRLSQLSGLERLVLYSCRGLCDLSGLSSLRNLRHLLVQHCRALSSLEALNAVAALETFELKYCDSVDSLVGLASSRSLKALSVYGCDGLTHLQDLSALHQLETLDLVGCCGLESLDGLSSLGALRAVCLSGCSSLEQVDELSGLPQLRHLALPDHLLVPLRMPQLESLAVRTTAALAQVELPALKELTIRRDIEPDLSNLSRFGQLERLHLGGCKKLAVLPSLGKLRALSLCDGRFPTLRLLDCTALETVELMGCIPLKEVAIVDCPALTTLTLGSGTKPTSINLHGCSSLVDLGPLAYHRQLKSLALVGCESLARLHLEGCCSLVELEGAATWRSLETLDVRGCIRLKSVAGLGSLSALRMLDLSDCVALDGFEQLAGLGQLQRLSLRGCQLRSTTHLASLPALIALDLSRCHELEALDGLASLPRLEALGLRECTALPSLVGLANAPSLRALDIEHCSRIRELQPLTTLATLESLRLSHCRALDDLPSLLHLGQRDGLKIIGCRSLPLAAALRAQPERSKRLLPPWSFPSPLPLERQAAENTFIAALLASSPIAQEALSDVDAAIASIDRRVHRQTDEIVNHRQMRQLEARWRGLWWLVCQWPPDGQLHLLNCSYDDLLLDFEDSPEIIKSGLYKHLYSDEYGGFGGRPYGLVVGDYGFGPSAEHMDVLSSCAEVARRSHLVFVAAAAPALLGVSSLAHRGQAHLSEPLFFGVADFGSRFQGSRKPREQDYRRSLDAKHVALVAGRLMVRGSYAAADAYPQATPDADPDSLGQGKLWATGALVFAARYASSCTHFGWATRIEGCVPGLMAHTQLEVEWTDAQRRHLIESGIVSLSRGGAGEVAIEPAPSCHRLPPGAPYHPLGETFMFTRLIQCMKLQHREQIGRWGRDVEEAERALQEWLDGYAGRAFASAELRFLRKERQRVFGLTLTPLGPGGQSLTVEIGFDAE